MKRQATIQYAKFNERYTGHLSQRPSHGYDSELSWTHSTVWSGEKSTGIRTESEHIPKADRSGVWTGSIRVRMEARDGRGILKAMTRWGPLHPK